jgi:hypothetical protein
MRTATRVFGVASALALGAGLSAAQNSNDSTFNNGGDVVFFYSDPSSGATSGAVPADITGDLYWRTHRGSNFINDVDAALGGSLMEVDGYYESLFDTDWSTTPHFYVRAHTFAFSGDVPNLAGYGAGTSGVTVLVGPSGFGAPCTVAPSICSPATTGSVCAAPGFVVGWIVDIGFGATVGSGVVITAAGTPPDDMATTWFVTGGMSASGGTCGGGDYAMQDVHSTDETQADPAGTGLNPSGGFQIAGGGLANESVASMAEGNEAWRGNIINVRANTQGGGVETSQNGGGAMNGRRLRIGGGGSHLGVELRDLAGSGGPNIGVVGASLTPLPNPGLPALGGNLLVLPDAIFNSTSAIWQGPVVPVTYVFTAEGAFTSAVLNVPTTAAGATLHIQGAVFSLTTFTLNSTNKVTTQLSAN